MPASTIGSRSMTSIASARSRGTIAHSLPGSRKYQPHWWQRRPILNTAYLTDLQKGSYIAALFTLVESIFQVLLAVFDSYCLLTARPGSRHFRSFGISFLFVYAGNEHIRRALIACAFLLGISAIYLLVSSVILANALKKEIEVKFQHWIRAMGLFIFVRVLTLIFASIVNDLFFAYHQAMLIIWFLLIAINMFAFLVVLSNYQELSNITKLEDMAKLKMSTISSLNASRSLSRNSLDSYKNYGGIINNQPSGGSRAGSTTGSIASFNMNYPLAQPTVGVGSGGHTSSASSIPLSSFGLNFNPNGVFTTAQLTGSQTLHSGGGGGVGGPGSSQHSGGRMSSTPSTAPI